MARRTTTNTFIKNRRRKVFVDTGAWYGSTEKTDENHEAAARQQTELTTSGVLFVTSDYIVDETLTRLRYDHGHASALRFLNLFRAAVAMGLLEVVRVDEEIWETALDIFIRYADAKFSFTDCTSFALCRREGIEEAFAFDSHFALFGLGVLPPER